MGSDYHRGLPGLLIIDPGGRLRAFNPTAEHRIRRWLARAPRSEEGVPALLAELGIDFDAHFQRALAGEHVRADHEVRTALTSGHWLELNCATMDSITGVTGVCLSFTDITERKREMDALARSEERFRSLVQYSSDYASILDRSGMRTYISPSVEYVLGYKATDLLDQNAFELIHPEDAPRVAEVFRQALKKPGIDIAVQFRGRRKDGSWIYLESIGNNLLDDPVVHGFIVSTRDITKQVEAQQLAIESVEIQMLELQKLNQFKDDFLGAVSHEMRTPLTAMRMAIGLLQREPVPERRAEYLRILEEQCERGAALISDLLELQKPDSIESSIHRTPVLIEEFLDAIVAPHRDRIERSRFELSIDTDPQLGSLSIDCIILRRIVAELLNNACKYTPPGGKIFVRSTLLPQAILELSVSNSGIRIEQEHLPHLFEKYYRVPGGDPGHQGGMGLGLTLVHSLVQRLKGTIRAESDDGWVRFVLTLHI